MNWPAFNVRPSSGMVTLLGIWPLFPAAIAAAALEGICEIANIPATRMAAKNVLFVRYSSLYAINDGCICKF
jgi:hypothetical protein